MPVCQEKVWQSKMAAFLIGGFDQTFLDEVGDDLTCPICHLVLQEPRQTDCGHEFCNACVGSLVRDGTVACPVCRTQLHESQIYPDNRLKRQILSLKIKCDKSEKGCEWIGELRHIEDHDDVCSYVDERCRCNGLVMRRDMEEHANVVCWKRTVNCDYCDKKIEYWFLKIHHGDCEKLPVQCVYDCDEMIARGEMDKHVSREGSCPNSQLDCDFKSVGCQFTGRRDELYNHVETNTTNHLLLVAADSKEQQRKNELDMEMTKLELEETKQEVEMTKDELEKTRDELENTKREFQMTKAALEMTKNELDETRGELEKTQQEMTEVKTHLEKPCCLVTMSQGPFVWRISK